MVGAVVAEHVFRRDRLAAVGAAIVLLLLRANFLVVVIGAAVVAGVLRALGWG